jgi:hypothetical protein
MGEKAERGPPARRSREGECSKTLFPEKSPGADAGARIRADFVRDPAE